MRRCLSAKLTFFFKMKKMEENRMIEETVSEWKERISNENLPPDYAKD